MIIVVITNSFFSISGRGERLPLLRRLDLAVKRSRIESEVIITWTLFCPACTANRLGMVDVSADVFVFSVKLIAMIWSYLYFHSIVHFTEERVCIVVISMPLSNGWFSQISKNPHLSQLDFSGLRTRVRLCWDYKRKCFSSSSVARHDMDMRRWSRYIMSRPSTSCKSFHSCISFFFPAQLSWCPWSHFTL